MKLETPQDLLNRVRARHDTSWYGLIRLMEVHKNTVYSWKGGHTSVDRRFAPKIAELLDESTEYVLACLEADREQDAEVLKAWRRIAEKFRGHAASVLLGGLVLVGLSAPTPSEAYTGSAEGAAHPSVYYDKYKTRAAIQIKELALSDTIPHSSMAAGLPIVVTEDLSAVSTRVTVMGSLVTLTIDGFGSGDTND